MVRELSAYIRHRSPELQEREKFLWQGTAADQDRLELARKNYNVEIVNVDEEDVDERMKGCFKYGKADIIFEATGVAANHRQDAATAETSGELILVCVYHGSIVLLLPARKQIHF